MIDCLSENSKNNKSEAFKLHVTLSDKIAKLLCI